MRKSLLFIAFFLFQLLVTGALTPSHAEPYKIGVIYGFTGPADKWSQWGRKGLELAVEEINNSGGINGTKLELVYEDNETNPAKSVGAFYKLLNTKDLKAIVASNWSILTNPLIPLSQSKRMVVISPSVMDASVKGSSDYFFTMGAKVKSVRPTIDTFFYLHPEVKKVAFLCWDDEWGHANLKMWEESAREHHIEVLDTICQGDYANDFRSDVTRIKNKQPDAVFVGMYPERVALRLKESGIRPYIFTTNVVMEPLDAPDISAEILEGMYFAYWNPNETFTKRFQEKFGADPLIEAHHHYEIIKSLADALKSFPNGVRTGLTKVKYEGASGMVDFTRGPFANLSPATLMQIKNKKALPVKLFSK